MESTAAGAAAPRVAALSTLERWAPAAGSLFAALFVAAFIIGTVGLDDVGDKLPEITRNFQTADYRSTGVFIAALVIAAAVFISPLLLVGHSPLEGGDPKTVATVYVVLTEIALGFFGLAGIAGALLMSAAVTVAYRNGLVPRWGAVAVIVGAIVTALTTWMFVLPILLVVLWVLVASVRRTILYRRGVLKPLA